MTFLLLFSGIQSTLMHYGVKKHELYELFLKIQSKMLKMCLEHLTIREIIYPRQKLKSLIREIKYPRKKIKLLIREIKYLRNTIIFDSRKLVPLRYMQCAPQINAVSFGNKLKTSCVFYNKINCFTPNANYHCKVSRE